MQTDFTCVESVELGLNVVFSEFGKVFGEHIPVANREEAIKAAAFCWLSEQLTSAVQNKLHYTRTQDIERANNIVRFGYGRLIHERGAEYHIDIHEILHDKTP